MVREAPATPEGEIGGLKDSGLEEDLPALAEYEFRVAQQACTDCREYHGLFGYARLSGLRSGMKTDGEMVASLIAKFTPMNGRILLAGSADAGLLALALRAAQGLNPKVTVADRCATPLAVCRLYLETAGRKAATVQADLTQATLPERYDVILAHNILPFIAAPRRSAFLSNLAGSLGAGGHLILVGSVKPVDATGIAVYNKKPEKILGALNAAQIPLPEDEAAFLQRLRALGETERARAASGLDLAQFEAGLAAAGLRVQQRIDHDRRQTTPSRDGELAIIRTHFFIAVAA